MKNNTCPEISPHAMIRPLRKITGMSAILLPFTLGAVDWEGFERHLLRTAQAGLIPAVNMDTGYATIINGATRREALSRARHALDGGRFVAGVCVQDHPGDPLNLSAYHALCDEVCEAGGTPVIMQSFGLTSLPEEEIVGAYRQISSGCDDFIAFELGRAFAPFGRIYTLDTYREIMGIEKCRGAKHSSLQREPEWRRIALRDAVRPDFMVLTGNDLAIDMVIYGSDYLLGLSTFAPDLFALRDSYWAQGHNSFYELNDLLQYLGSFAFRDPVPAYKASAAHMLKLQGWITSDEVPSGGLTRPASDIAILETILEQMNIWRDKA